MSERSFTPSDSNGADFMDCKQCPLKALGVCKPAAELQEADWEGASDEIDELCEKAQRMFNTGKCMRKSELQDALRYCTDYNFGNVN